MKETRCKQLYKGIFNYSREIYILYRYAFTERQVWFQMCRYLAKKDGVHPSVVMNLFDGSKDNFKITIEMEIKEDGEDKS